MKNLLMIGLLSCLVGCSTTSGTGAQTSVSNFDGVKSVAIQPHGAACKGMVCPMLGATWLDNQPNNVGFSVELFNEIASIHSVAFNIDGQIIKVDALLPTNFSPDVSVKASRTSVLLPYSVLTQILQSKRTWLRVSTSKGTYEAAIVDGAVDSKAFNALKRFDAQVKEASTK
jgi:hypothetical protein